MFVRYTFDITNECSAESVVISILFKNMKTYAQLCHDSYPYEVHLRLIKLSFKQVPDDYTPVTFGEKYRNYVRKEQVCRFNQDALTVSVHFRGIGALAFFLVEFGVILN